MNRAHGVLIAIILASSARIARATPGDAVPLEYDATRDGVITVGSVTASVLAETLLKTPLAPTTCHWCDPPGFDTSVRDALVWSHTTPANVASWGTLAATPLVAYGSLTLFARPGEAGQNAMIVSESVGVVWLATSVTKFAVGRQRPIVHFRGDGYANVPANDVNLSFFSGHSSLAFAFATSAGTVASLRRYPEAPWIWGSGLAFAAATGWLRIAADEHYASDVLAGAAVGSLGGVLVPLLLHPRRGPSRETSFIVLAAPTQGGAWIGVGGLL